MKNAEILAKMRKDHEAKVAELNVVCKNGSFAEVAAKEDEVKAIEKEYKKLMEVDVFSGLADMEEAIKKHHFETISHKAIREEGVLQGYEVVEKTVQVNLQRFAERKDLDMGWFYDLQGLNKRLTLKVATDLGLSDKEIKAISDSYYMNKLVKELEGGKTITSNTQIIKHMQSVLDAVAPESGKVNNYDLTYVMLTYAKRNRKALCLQCANHANLLSLMTDVFYRILTGAVYSVDYKKVVENSEPVEKPAKETKKASTKKVAA